MKDVHATELVNGPRKTFIVGFAVSANSISATGKKLLNKQYSITNLNMYLHIAFCKTKKKCCSTKSEVALAGRIIQTYCSLRALLQRNKITAPEKANSTVIKALPVIKLFHSLEG